MIQGMVGGNSSRSFDTVITELELVVGAARVVIVPTIPPADTVYLYRLRNISTAGQTIRVGLVPLYFPDPNIGSTDDQGVLLNATDPEWIIECRLQLTAIASAAGAILQRFVLSRPA